jgi:hypothetical protein
MYLKTETKFAKTLNFFMSETKKKLYNVYESNNEFFFSSYILRIVFSRFFCEMHNANKQTEVLSVTKIFPFIYIHGKKKKKTNNVFYCRLFNYFQIIRIKIENNLYSFPYPHSSSTQLSSNPNAIKFL